MNSIFQGLMNEAANLTRSGRLADATKAIQRALRGGDAPPAPNPDDRVIDVESRVLDADRPAPAQREATGAEQWIEGSFTRQGRTLDYMLFVPAGTAAPGAPRPLVLMLHGCTQNPADFAAGTRMNDHARAAGALVLYPAQTQHANGQKCWNWFKPQHQQRGRGEPALLAALTQQVIAQHHVDPARVYVAGLSAGGAMADVLGHCYPDIYAAVGVHSGLPHGAANDVMTALSVMRSGASASPRAADVPPAIVFHGDADSTVHAANGQAIVAGAAPVEVTEGQSPAGQRFTRTRYEQSEHWRLHGAGHAWSGGSPQGSYTQAAGVDASQEMLRFFLARRLKTAG